MSEMTGIAGILEEMRKRATRHVNDPDYPKIVYKCPKCEDKGYYFGRINDDYTCVIDCECAQARLAEQLMQQSGLGEALKNQTFDTFVADGPVGKTIKDTARRYVDALLHPENDSARVPWMFVGGNPGSGKTHICTAVCGELLRNNVPVRYMEWNEEARRLKAYVNDPALDDHMEPYLNCRVLYIDDLFKGASGRLACTDADIRLAFSLLNTRYLRNLPVIISCEWELLKDLMPIDEGLFSRVYERARGYVLRIERDVKYNYRIWQKGQ